MDKIHQNIHAYINTLVIKMVYDSETNRPLHKMTEEGEDAYRLMLELKADKILFKATHPIKYLI